MKKEIKSYALSKEIYIQKEAKWFKYFANIYQNELFYFSKKSNYKAKTIK